MFHMKFEIESIPIEKLNEIIETRKPKGLFIAREPKGKRKRLFITVENVDGEAYTEEFEEYKQAMRWLEKRGEE